MEIILAFVIGGLFAASVFLMLKRNIIKRHEITIVLCQIFDENGHIGISHKIPFFSLTD